MEKLKEIKKSSKKLFDGRLIKVKIDTVKLPNGKESTREVIEHPGAVAVIALTDENEMILVRQFRYPTGEVLLELPAGVPNKGEALEKAARRELEEETGYYAKKVKKILSGYSTPGYSNEIINYFIAEELTLHKQNMDEDEFVEVDIIDLEALLDLAYAGKITDNKTIIGIMMADAYLKGKV
ncbi:MAG: NUDIX hydrolase [Candidatus Margulisiibacteriota bacterium]|jgi:ADP-ribose pyrophosphatase